MDTTSRRGLIVGLLFGLPVMAYGVRGVFVDATDTHPGELARWVLGAALLHDLVVVPVVLAAAAGARRLARRDSTWRIARAWFLVAASLVLVGWPFLRGYGRSPAVPSALNRNYGLGLTLYLAAATLIALALVPLVRAVDMRKEGRHGHRGRRHRWFGPLRAGARR